MKLKDKMNKQYTQVAIYVIITCIVIYSLSLVAKNAPVILDGIFEKLSWFFSVVKPVIFGFVFAYLVEPLVVFFEKQYGKIKFLKKKKQKSLRMYGVITTILILLVFIAVIISLLVYSVTDQLRVANFDDLVILSKEYVSSINDLYNTLLQKLNSIDIQSVEFSNYIKQASTYILGIIKEIANGAVSSLSNFSGYLTTFLFTLIIGIYFMIDGKIIKAYISKVFYALFNDRTNHRVRGLIKDADSVFSGYIRGQLMDATVMMFLIGISLSIVGIKFSVLIGIIAGIGNLIPYCGPFIAYAGTILVCLMNGDIKHLIIGVIVLLVIQTIDANIIGPKLLSQCIEIHPLLVIISLIFGSAVGGLFGMLLAVPVGAFIKLLFVRFIDYRIDMKEQQKELEDQESE
ncbi:AI-2E family transporter [Anaeromicropila herbilytica]|uniref:AI-2E family transporter n=1 Tax=Anaeromicropila herbilytica TaxID=2785025 RepID=A0A7R7EP80_9FIRM|nr:AI-2E family transporter [Anaeromicropila herbilytica]BCN32443.1 AI-2E family transporter [Anaeromicropila herbilytica]